MAFWTQSSVDPDRQNRFRIRFTPLNAAANEINRQRQELAELGLQNPKPATQSAQASTPQMSTTDTWWWVKSCTLPSFEVSQLDYQMVNFKFKYPGMLTWNDVVITMVDVGGKIEQILQILKSSGYGCPGECDAIGIQKGGFSSQGDLRIEQLAATGNALRTWNLRNWFIKSIRFGELSYESDELVSTEITIGYDCAVLEAA